MKVPCGIAKSGERPYFAAMPDIELGPNEYRKQIKGRWHLPDDPKLCRTMFWVAAAMIGLVFMIRSQGTNPVDMGLAAILAFAAGINFAIWKRDVY